MRNWAASASLDGRRRRVVGVAGALTAAALIAACGGSGSGGGSTPTGTNGTSMGGSGATVTVAQSTFPDSLDPGFGYTTQSEETNWLVYTGLTTYAHRSGTAGTTLIPGIARALPRISDGGRTYTARLRPGLRYSDGRPVKACDVRFAIERAVKIPWGGSGAFMTPVISGASAFAAGRSGSISGIACDDRTGTVVFHLTRAYGAFDNVLAEPAAAPVPQGSVPLRNDPLHPPAGIGPYRVTDIVANQSYRVVRNPRWHPLPGIPAGHVDLQVKVNPNVSANAEAVLNNTADIFDFADTIPGSLLAQIRARAASRFRLLDLGNSVYYFFLNSQTKPFSSQLAREAVITGLNEDAYAREGSGTLTPACFFLTPAVPGHPTNARCPYGTPGNGDLARARALLRRSGMAGQHVTVWSDGVQPREQWMTTYTQYLNQLGLHATQKVISDSTYFQTVGELKLHPQTGFDDWVEDFPNPVDFYGPKLVGSAILKVNNRNRGEVDDPHINREVARLGTVPSTDLSRVTAAWQSLDEYEARRAYTAVFGYQRFPFFASSRIDYGAVVESPIYGWDFSSLRLR